MNASVGGIKSDDLINSTKLQFLLGITSGLLEYKAGIGVYNKANTILNFKESS